MGTRQEAHTFWDKALGPGTVLAPAKILLKVITQSLSHSAVGPICAFFPQAAVIWGVKFVIMFEHNF